MHRMGAGMALPPADKEMKLAMGTPAHHAAVKKHTLASEAHAKALKVAQKAASRSPK